MKRYDVVVVGGGAAGLFCAAQAGRRGRRVAVIEHNDRVGRKIEISGGGRCNFTNLHATPEQFLSDNPRFCISALKRYTPYDFISLVESHGLSWHEKTLGQLFCDQRSAGIIRMLVDECRQSGVDIHCTTRVKTAEHAGEFIVRCEPDDYACEALVVAAGGLSVEKVGASDIAYRIARRFGHSLIEPRPGLVPFTLDERDLERWSGLRGLSFAARTLAGGAAFDENILFTHRGLSGPAILQISNYWREGDALRINLMPDGAGAFIEENGRRDAKLATALSQRFPARFAQRWADNSGFNKPMKQLNPRELERLEQTLSEWTLTPSGTEGFHKAEVTLGGVDTRELSPKTMESQKQPGLYFIGEAVDVTGWLGGYNFQWAWASAHAAGTGV